MERAFALALALAAAGCKEKAVEPTPVPASSAPPAPVDHLAPGELLEGTEKAFGLPFPRGLTVVHGYDDLVIASGLVPSDAVANYFRARLPDAQVTVGPQATVLDRGRSKYAPDLELSVRVEPGMGGAGSRVTVRRLTQPKAPVLPDDEARWRAAGFKPNGEPLDRKSLQ
jgi:hypothetical protein